MPCASIEVTEKTALAAEAVRPPLAPLMSPRPGSAVVASKAQRSDEDDAEGLVLAIKWRCFHCHCHDFRFYVTLFPKCFSNFRSRYLFDIGLPTLYLTLADTYLPIDASLPRSATRLVLLSEVLGFLAQWAVTFFGSILT